MRRIMGVAGTVAVAALLLGACDANRDDYIDEDDLEQTFESARTEVEEAAADVSADIERFFAEWDENADRALDTEEFAAWWDRVNPFDDWDANDDERLARAEWDTVLLLDMEEVDANDDGEVTREELEAGLFDALDQDGSGRIERIEWRRVGM